MDTVEQGQQEHAGQQRRLPCVVPRQTQCTAHARNRSPAKCTIPRPSICCFRPDFRLSDSPPSLGVRECRLCRYDWRVQLSAMDPVALLASMYPKFRVTEPVKGHCTAFKEIVPER